MNPRRSIDDLSAREYRLARRSFLASAASATAALSFGRQWAVAAASETAAPANRGRIFKSVKWGMIDVPGSPRDRFELCHDLGFDGMELISPCEFNADEINAASRATGMPVHGVVDMKHWEIRLSSPHAATREQGRQILEQALRNAKSFGGDSVLLVPGRVSGDDENHDHVWNRSIAQIRKVLPLASRLGVRILIENVWNGFCEAPELLRDYIDEIASPWVGVYFDIGNVRKFGPSEEWIRVLGRRIVKLDVKDWGRANGFCKIGEGDVDWSAVRTALNEIGFAGWCTAEVEGGGRDRLADIAQRMRRVLEL